MMKKALTFLLLAAMLTATLAGCGNAVDTPAKTTDGADNGTTNGTTASTTAGTDGGIPEYNPPRLIPRRILSIR